LGLKAGFELTGFPFRNLRLTFEYTRTNPLVYKHFVPSTTFYNDQYSLGNYLRDNSQEFFVSINFRPMRGLLGTLSYLVINHGTDYPYKPGVNQGFPFLGEVVSCMRTFGFSVNYQLVNRGIMILSYEYCRHSGDTRYFPLLTSGITNNLKIGFSFGF